MYTVGSLRHWRRVNLFAVHIRDSYRPVFSAKLEGCILGRNTKVGARADLLRSLTQAGYEADAGGKNPCLACFGLRPLPW